MGTNNKYECHQINTDVYTYSHGARGIHHRCIASRAYTHTCMYIEQRYNFTLDITLETSTVNPKQCITIHA